MSEVGEIGENIAWKNDSPTPFIQNSVDRGLKLRGWLFHNPSDYLVQSVSNKNEKKKI